MQIKSKCACDGTLNLMFCCSGAADTAEIADLAVRKVHKEKGARMYCVAGVASEAELIMTNFRAATGIVVVDGCETDCARKTMERAGFADFLNVRVTDLGMEKGKTPVTPERVDEIAARIRVLFAA